MSHHPTSDHGDKHKDRHDGQNHSRYSGKHQEGRERDSGAVDPDVLGHIAALERRALAHEQILQVLIAHMTEAQPKFLDRLQNTFSSGHVLGADEQDFTGTEQYADAFVRQIIAIGDGGTPYAPGPTLVEVAFVDVDFLPNKLDETTK